MGPTRSTILVSFSMVGRWGFSRESSLARGKVRRRATRASFWSSSRSLVLRNVSHDVMMIMMMMMMIKIE